MIKKEHIGGLGSAGMPFEGQRIDRRLQGHAEEAVAGLIAGLQRVRPQVPHHHPAWQMLLQGRPDPKLQPRIGVSPPLRPHLALSPDEAATQLSHIQA